LAHLNSAQTSLAAHLLFLDLFSFFQPFGPSRRTAPSRPKSVASPFSFLPQPRRPSFICPTQPMWHIWPLACSIALVQYRPTMSCHLPLVYQPPPPPIPSVVVVPPVSCASGHRIASCVTPFHSRTHPTPFPTLNRCHPVSPPFETKALKSHRRPPFPFASRPLRSLQGPIKGTLTFPVPHRAHSPPQLRISASEPP
jgi:hypothetical protein